MPVQSSRLDAWQPLPRKVHIKNNAFYYVHGNKWHGLGRTVEAAKTRYCELLTELGLPHVAPDFLEFVHQNARSRARRLKVDFEISLADVHRLFDESGGKCAVTGLPLDCSNVAAYKRRPWIPSLDRANCREGYTVANTRLVCFAANAAMNAWGEEAFEKVALGFLKRRGVI